MPTQQSTIILIFTAVTAFGVLMQAFVLLAIFLGSRKAMKRVDALSEELKGHVVPVLVTTRRLLDETSPKINEAVRNLTVAAEELRNQTSHINSTVGEIVEKTRLQAERVDGMVTDALDGISSATHSVQRVLSVPVRQVSGLFSGLRAGIDALRSRERQDHSAEDKDLFV